MLYQNPWFLLLAACRRLDNTAKACGLPSNHPPAACKVFVSVIFRDEIHATPKPINSLGSVRKAAAGFAQAQKWLLSAATLFTSGAGSLLVSKVWEFLASAEDSGNTQGDWLRPVRPPDTETSLQPQHFPQAFGEPFRHPLESEVVGMSAIHQTVHAGRT
jgi:hypothetical protein